MRRALYDPEALAARAVQREEHRQRGKAAKMNALLPKKDAKVSTAGSVVQQVVLAMFSAQQQTPVVLAGPSQGGMSAGDLQLPAGKEPRKAISSAVHSLLARVLQRPPATTQLLDLGAKGGTGGFAVIWSDAGSPKAPWMWVPLEEARAKLHPAGKEAGWRAV